MTKMNETGTSGQAASGDKPAGPGARPLAEFARALRDGTTSAVDETQAFLDRIDRLGERVGAFTHVDAERALTHARAIDALLRARVDLGPLMGVPVVVKDLFAVDGMPMNLGSRAELPDLVPSQGSFVTALQRAGCVILGKTRTVEFALGGYNLTHRLPWNPCDAAVPRMTGGSSHGSAAAMGAGLCGFAIGSDTGGSVRWPAALCGVVGYKSTTTRWPGDGIFPLSPQMDSIGYFTASAADAALIEAAIDGQKPLAVPDASGLTFAISKTHFLENLDPPVAACFDTALTALKAAGCRIVERDAGESREIDEVFRALVPSDLLAHIGRERFERILPQMDPVAADRARVALQISADEYVRLSTRRRHLERLMRERSTGIDAWISPTVPMLPAPTSEFQTVEAVAAWNRRATQNTRPGNLFNQCGVSLPIQHLGAGLPVGLQLTADGGRDAELLAIAVLVERILGAPPPLEMARL